MTLWQSVSDNVDDGRIRIVIAADEIPPELQAVIEYLNEQLRSAEVYALGVIQYEANGRRVFVPRLAGATVAARSTKGGGGNPAPGYEAILAQASDEAREAGRLLDDWAAAKGIVHIDGSASRKWITADGRTVCRLYPGWPIGSRALLEFNLGDLRDAGRSAKADELFGRFQAVIPRKIQGNRAPTALGQEILANWSSLVATLDSLLKALSG